MPDATKTTDRPDPGKAVMTVRATWTARAIEAATAAASDSWHEAKAAVLHGHADMIEMVSGHLRMRRMLEWAELRAWNAERGMV